MDASAVSWARDIAAEARRRGIAERYRIAYLAETGFYDVTPGVYLLSIEKGDHDMVRLKEWLPPLVEEAVYKAYMSVSGPHDDAWRWSLAMERAIYEAAVNARRAVEVALEWLRDTRDA